MSLSGQSLTQVSHNQQSTSTQSCCLHDNECDQSQNYNLNLKVYDLQDVKIESLWVSFLHAMMLFTVTSVSGVIGLCWVGILSFSVTKWPSLLDALLLLFRAGQRRTWCQWYCVWFGAACCWHWCRLQRCAVLPHICLLQPAHRSEPHCCRDLGLTCG